MPYTSIHQSAVSHLQKFYTKVLIPVASTVKKVAKVAFLLLIVPVRALVSFVTIFKESIVFLVRNKSDVQGEVSERMAAMRKVKAILKYFSDIHDDIKCDLSQHVKWMAEKFPRFLNALDARMDTYFHLKDPRPEQVEFYKKLYRTSYYLIDTLAKENRPITESDKDRIRFILDNMTYEEIYDYSKRCLNIAFRSICSSVDASMLTFAQQKLHYLSNTPLAEIINTHYKTLNAKEQTVWDTHIKMYTLLCDMFDTNRYKELTMLAEEAYGEKFTTLDNSAERQKFFYDNFFRYLNFGEFSIFSKSVTSIQKEIFDHIFENKKIHHTFSDLPHSIDLAEYKDYMRENCPEVFITLVQCLEDDALTEKQKAHLYNITIYGVVFIKDVSDNNSSFMKMNNIKSFFKGFLFHLKEVLCVKNVEQYAENCAKNMLRALLYNPLKTLCDGRLCENAYQTVDLQRHIADLPEQGQIDFLTPILMKGVMGNNAPYRHLHRLVGTCLGRSEEDLKKQDTWQTLIDTHIKVGA